MGASAAVLPGVGAFGTCMDNLRRHGLIEPVKIFVASGRPFLGICVGMQILFDESEEFGPVRGLGILPGKVVRFAPDPEGKRKVPQMGWNALTIEKRAPHLAGSEGRRAGLLRALLLSGAGRSRRSSRPPPTTAATFASSVWQDNVFACQFHPEKSQAVGLRILANFAALAGETGAAAAAR